MEKNNENGKYKLHFTFSYKYSTYQIFMDTQLVRRQET